MLGSKTASLLAASFVGMLAGTGMSRPPPHVRVSKRPDPDRQEAAVLKRGARANTARQHEAAGAYRASVFTHRPKHGTFDRAARRREAGGSTKHARVRAAGGKAAYRKLLQMV